MTSLAEIIYDYREPLGVEQCQRIIELPIFAFRKRGKVKVLHLEISRMLLKKVNYLT